MFGREPNSGSHDPLPDCSQEENKRRFNGDRSASNLPLCACDAVNCHRDVFALLISPCKPPPTTRLSFFLLNLGCVRVVISSFGKCVSERAKEFFWGGLNERFKEDNKFPEAPPISSWSNYI